MKVIYHIKDSVVLKLRHLHGVEGHLLSVPLVSRRPAQVLSSFLDLQLLSDLSANSFSLLVQKLLHTGI